MDDEGLVPLAGADGWPARRGAMARSIRSLGDPRGSRAPAAVDLAGLRFSLSVPGGAPEYAPRPLRRTGALSGSHLEEVPRVGSWAAEAACRNRTALFFPVRGQRPQAAIALCERCPVVEQCQAYGLANPAQLGILGALTIEDRRRVRAEMRVAVKGARGTPEQPLFVVLDQLARYPVGTWGEIARSDDAGVLERLAFELDAGWRPLAPGRWEFDAERIDGEGVLRARLLARDLSVLTRVDSAAG